MWWMRISMTHKVVIDRIEEDKVVCQFEDGTKITVPLNRMPDDVGEGDSVFLSIDKDKPGSVKEKADAKELLNELLK